VLTTTAARKLLADHLLKDAVAHEAGRYDEIGRRFDAFERAFPDGDGNEQLELRIALTFWDAWIDARNHGWQPTAGIQPNEWPVLAREIVADLNGEGPVGSTRLRRLFDAVGQSGLGERAKTLAARLKERWGVQKS
jgi:hypothetical protein